MKVSTHNGLEVWLECRLPPHGHLAKDDKKSEIPPDPVVIIPPRARLEERPHRISVETCPLIITGSLDDSENISTTTTSEYRLAVKQSTYDDWREDLKVEIKTKDQRTLVIEYLIPAIYKVTYFDLGDWSPFAQDNDAKVLGSVPPVEVTRLPDEVVEVIPDGLDSGLDVNDEALQALSFLETHDTDPIETAVEVQTVQTAPTALTWAQAPVVSFQEPVIFPARRSIDSPPISMNGLEISMYRGMYTPLPSSPPPPYIEKDIGTVEYNGSVPLTFGERPEEWNGHDPEGAPWCKFIYEVGEDDQPTINPWILEGIQAKDLLQQFDQLTVDLEAQSLYEQRQIRKAARQKLRDEKAERKALEEKERQEQIDAAAAAAAIKEKNRQAGRKGWQTQLAKGRVPAAPKKTPAIRRLQNEDRQVIKSPIPGVLKLRPGNIDTETDPDVQRGRHQHPTSSKHRQLDNSLRGSGSGGVLKLRPDLENSSGSRSHSRHPVKSDRDHSLPRSRVQARREEIVAGPSRSSSTRDDRGTRLSRDNRPYRDDRERRESRDEKSRDERHHRPPHQSTSSKSDTRDSNARPMKPFIDDEGRLHPGPPVSNRDQPLVKIEVRPRHNESRGTRLSRPPDAAPLRRQPYIVPTHPRTSSNSRPGTGRTDRPEFYGLSTFSYRREITGGIYHDPTRVKRETGTHSHPNRVKRERPSEEEEEEEELSPMEEQHRAYWQRKEEREAKRRKMAEKEDRRRLRRLEAKAEVRDRAAGDEEDEDWLTPASGDQRVGLDYRLDRIKMEAVGEVIDLSQLSD